MSQPLKKLRSRLAAATDSLSAPCVVLDGANGTELQRQVSDSYKLSDDTHWGFDVLHTQPDVVKNVHKAYVAAGCDILTTNTYSILEAPTYSSDANHSLPDPAHWMDLARRSVKLARQAASECQRADDVAVAFSVGGDIRGRQDVETIDLLLRALQDTPPDLILFETVTMVGENMTMPMVDALISEGHSVWVSFRRCQQGACGIHGQIWGGPEGDRFGRLVKDLEDTGCEAVLINCLPIDRVGDTISWLRDFTDLPLGVYPNLGRAVENGWQYSKDGTGPDTQSFIEHAAQWRHQGASIIGGCCGVGPAEINRLVRDLSSTVNRIESSPIEPPVNRPPLSLQPWSDETGRTLFPLSLPKMRVEPGVFMPTQGSYLIWKHLYRDRIGAGQRCLDIGCGAGILAVQLALNGASEVTAIDIDEASVENTEVNAHRNGVAERVKGLKKDLYLFQPDEAYDVIVASLYQMPTDPGGQLSGHRDVDYWGRNLLDHFITELPSLLKKNGTAYVMQVSMIGAEKTSQLLAANGYRCKVVDFNLYQFNKVFMENLEQINKVESLSDAYHFEFDKDEHVMVMYLLEINHAT